MSTKCAAAPCKSCPYRRDVPSGVWASSEYHRLRKFDGSLAEQAFAGAVGLFMCHSSADQLCAGWIACHSPENLLALRLHSATIDPSVWRYTTSVPLFSSGREACEHGKCDIENPGPQARKVVSRLLKNRRIKMATSQSSKTHCPQGHPYAGDNLIVMKVKKDGVDTGKRKRQCRECKRQSHKDRAKPAPRIFDQAAE